MNKNNHDDDEQEPNTPQTLEEALWVITYYSGVFILKCLLIIVAWVGIVHYLEQWLIK